MSKSPAPLKLSDISPLLRTGDIILFQGKSAFARIIRLYQTLTFRDPAEQAAYTHAGFLFWQQLDGFGRWVVAEALEPYGVRLFPLDVYLEDCLASGIRADWYPIDQRGLDPERLVGYVLRQWGKRYASPWQFLISFGWVHNAVRRLLGRKPRLLDRDRFFCSELVAAALKYAGFRALPGEPYAITPSQLSRLSCVHLGGTLVP